MSSENENTRSHLQWTDQLSGDIAKIEEFKDHKFENLYYSPSTNEFYQAPKIKYRILYKDDKHFRCRTNKSTSTKISLKKIKEKINLTNNATE